MKSVITVQEAAELIHSGKQLFVAGDEQLLRQLPHGQWIGGTIPYFMGEDGGVCTHDALQVAVLPDFIQAAEIRFYEESELDSLPRHYKPNGFTRIIVPASSATAAATHGMQNPLLCLVTIWFPLNTAGLPPP